MSPLESGRLIRHSNERVEVEGGAAAPAQSLPKIMLMPHFPPLTMAYISLRGSCQHAPAMVNNEEFVCSVIVSNSSISYN